jgi:hypothetical protein
LLNNKFPGMSGNALRGLQDSRSSQIRASRIGSAETRLNANPRRVLDLEPNPGKDNV